ncbi:MAG: serine hydrolase [Patescibacteria group bacterium]
MRRRKRTGRIVILFIFCIVLFPILYGILWQRIYQTAMQMQSTPRIATTPVQVQVQSTMVSIPDQLSLKKPLEEVLDGSTDSYAVVVKELQTNKSYAADEHHKFTAASLYKLWVMAVVYEQLEQGKLTESDVLKKDVVDLHKTFNIATESAEKKSGTVTLSVANALSRMIMLSDNYAAWLLTDKVGLKAINVWLKEHGFADSSFGSEKTLPSTTASDVSLFFEKLADGELGSQESTDAMLDLLTRQQLNGKIPKYLPSSVDIAHKTGELGKYSHDAGIIYAPQGDYILVVLSESASRIGADARIGRISEAVYEYFEDQ